MIVLWFFGTIGHPDALRLRTPPPKKVPFFLLDERREGFHLLAWRRGRNRIANVRLRETYPPSRPIVASRWKHGVFLILSPLVRACLGSTRPWMFSPSLKTCPSAPPPPRIRSTCIRSSAGGFYPVNVMFLCRAVTFFLFKTNKMIQTGLPIDRPQHTYPLTPGYYCSGEILTVSGFR